MSSQNSWKDIPPEIVDQILGYCDEPSLLVLGRVNYQLNFDALSRYFAPQIKGDVIQLPLKHTLENSSLEHKYLEGDRHMRALRTALWLPKAVQHIDYYLTPGARYSRYINDLCYMTIFIYQMPRLVSLRVDSGCVADAGGFNRQSHRGVWNRLSKAAILKGCEILKVEEDGLDFFAESFLSPKPSVSLRDSILQPRSRLFRTFQVCRGPTLKRTILSLNPSFLFSSRSTRVGKPLLREVEVYGSSIPPLITYAILTSLTRLSLTNLDGVWDQKNLKKNFDRIHFNKLQSFAFFNCCAPSPIIFLKFLHRHQTLVELDLNVNFRINQIWSPTKWSLWCRPPTFPNLQKVKMFPEILRWLVPDFHRQCPMLRSVTLKGCPWSYEDTLWPCEPQDVIISILNDLHPSPSLTWPLEVEIRLPLGDSSWVSKLNTVATHPGWSRVKALKLEDTKPSYSVLPIPSILVSWLSTFSSLECLEISSLMEVFGKEFVESLAVRCPRFKTFGITHYPLHADNRFGQQWKMWVVQDGRVRSYSTNRIG